MILIKNTQRKIAIDAEQFKKDVQTILDILEYADFDIGILLTTNARIRTYNRAYRKKDKPTDILSFPFHPHLKAGSRIVAQSDEDKNIGDIIISLEYVAADAKKHEEPFEKRLKMILVHGICHLLGYDHIEDDDYAQMIKKESELLRALE